MSETSSSSLWIMIVVLICLSMTSTLAVLFSIMRKRGKETSAQKEILKNGQPGKARITSVRDTNVRNGRDYFILQVSIEVIEPTSMQGPLTLRTPVSPLDFHRMDVGADIDIRLDPRTGQATLVLPATNL